MSVRAVAAFPATTARKEVQAHFSKKKKSLPAPLFANSRARVVMPLLGLPQHVKKTVVRESLPMRFFCFAPTLRGYHRSDASDQGLRDAIWSQTQMFAVVASASLAAGSRWGPRTVCTSSFALLPTVEEKQRAFSGRAGCEGGMSAIDVEVEWQAWHASQAADIDHRAEVPFAMPRSSTTSPATWQKNGNAHWNYGRWWSPRETVA